MELSHEFSVGFAKSFGLFWLIALSIGITAYAYWPSLGRRFDIAAKSILDDEDGPVRDCSRQAPSVSSYCFLWGPTPIWLLSPLPRNPIASCNTKQKAPRFCARRNHHAKRSNKRPEQPATARRRLK